MQKLRSFLVYAVVLAALPACDSIKKLRAVLHGDPNDAGTASDPNIDTGTTALIVTVEPAQGVTVLIDGIKVANHSPFSTTLLDPGAHVLVVRGMGYLPLTLPITLKEHELLKVPVSLRARPVAAPEPETDPDAGGAPTSAPPSEPTALDRPPSADLPNSIAPIDLHLVAQPAAPAMLDGQRIDGKAVHIRRSRGMLQVGLMSMPYGVTPGRVLELNIPADEATWHKDGVVMRPGSLVRLSHGFTRLRRLANDGTDQSMILRRIN